MSTFADRLKKRRSSLKISQAQLAELSGVHLIQISRYETGIQYPNVKTMEAIAHALQVSLDWLLDLDYANPEPLTPKEKELIEIFRSKAPERQDTVIEVARLV